MKQNLVTIKTLRAKLSIDIWNELGKKKHSSKDGSVMEIARKSLITIRKTSTIKHAAEKMAMNSMRRIFITARTCAILGK